MRLRRVRSRSYRYRREHWLNEHPCERTGIINQIRAFLLERGVAVGAAGILRTELPLSTTSQTRTFAIPAGCGWAAAHRLSIG
jgi:hypothetical protein